jgi:hypothetical protein
MSQQIAAISPLRYDDYFMPLTCEAELLKKKMQMSKSEFKKFMTLEKKKEKFNMTLFEYSKEHEKNRLEIKNIQECINSYNSMIKSFKERNIKIDGNLETVERIVKDTRNKIKECINLSTTKRSEYRKLFENYRLKYMKFQRQSSIVHIEEKIYLNNVDTRSREKEERASKEHQTFLKLLDKLPDDLLRLIKSYFTYETRAAILVKTYNPVKMFCALDKIGLIKTVMYINNKYAPINKLWSAAWKVDHELHKKMVNMYCLFYDRYKCKYILSTTDMRLYIQNIFLLFHEHQQHKWCFDLYRAIIVCKNRL